MDLSIESFTLPSRPIEGALFLPPTGTGCVLGIEQCDGWCLAGSFDHLPARCMLRRALFGYTVIFVPSNFVKVNPG